MKKIALVYFIISMSFSAFAQVSYSFQSLSGTYSPISGQTYAPAYTNNNLYDDAWTNAINIGFDFNFYGNTYNRIVLNTNGLLYLTNSTDVSSAGYGHYSVPLNSINNAIAAFTFDLQTKTNSTTSVSSVNGVFTAQWSNYQRLGSEYNGDNLNFQIKLYRDDSRIEITYGTMTLATFTGNHAIQVGIRGSSSLLNVLSSTNSWISPIGTTSTSSTIVLSNTVLPTNGRTYRFTPNAIRTFALTGDMAFGNVPINSGVARNLNIRNTGNTTITLTSLNLPSRYTSTFSPRYLYPNEIATYPITFSPNVIATFNGTLSFSNSSSAVGNTLSVTGAGISNVTLVPVLSVNQSSLSFEKTQINPANHETQPIVITNQGNTTLTISSITISSGSGNFNIIEGGTTSSISIPNGGTRTIRVRFNPTSSGNLSGILRIISNSNNVSNTETLIALNGEAFNPIRRITVNPSSLNFGEFINGQELPDKRNFIICNEGNVAMRVTGSSATGDFRYTIPTANLEAGACMSVDVQFNPSSSGNKSGNITIQSDATQIGSNTISLQGTAIAPTKTITISTNIINFGDIEIDSESNTQTLTITNTGNSSIRIDGITFPNSNFKVKNFSFPATIGLNGSITIPLVFSSNTTGNQETTMTIRGNLTSTTNTSVSLKANVPSRVIVLNNSNLSFGEVEINTSRTLYLIIQNTGTSNLKVDKIESSNSAFICSWSGTIQANGSQYVDVIFRPTSVQSYSTTLTVTSNKTSGTNTTTASGTGVQARLELTGSANFGEVRKDEQSVNTITIKNSGSTTAQNVMITLPNGFASNFPSSLSLLPNQSYSFQVYFRPTEAKIYSDDLKVKGSNTSETNTRLTGTGIQAVVSLPTTVDFGEVRKLETDQVKKMNLTITNTGDAPLLVTGISFSDPSIFSATSSNTLTILKNQPQSIQVSFVPKEAKVYNANYTIQVSKSESTSGVLTGTLRGEGTEAVISLEGNLDFGYNYTYSTITKTLTIRNLGKAPLFIGNVNSNSSDFSIKQNNFEVAPNSIYPLPIEVNFKPTEIRDRSAIFTFSYSKYAQSTSGKNTIESKGRGVERIIITNKGNNNEVLHNLPNPSFGATLNANAEPQKATFYYKTIGADKYQVRTTTFSSNMISDIVLKMADFNDIGIVYYFEVTDLLGKTIQSTPSHTYVKYLVSDLDMGIISGGTSVSQYKIIAIPLEMTDKTSKTFLEKNWGSYNTKAYRFFQYSNGQNIEYPTLNSIDLGRGYWILSKDNKGIKNAVDGIVTKITDSKPYYELTLQQGWNQIGNPFLFDITWANLISFNQNNLLKPKLHLFKNGALQSGETLEKFSGGFVFATQATTIKFPVSSKKGGRIESDVLPKAQWTLDFSLLAENKTYSEAQIGMDKEARNQGLDQFDQPALPIFFEKYAHIVFPSKEYFYPHLSSDIAQEAENHVWEFHVQSSLGGRHTLKFDQIPNEQKEKLVLYDVYNQTVVKLSKQDTYTFLARQNHPFRLCYGTQEFIEQQLIPEKVLIGEIFPNPYLSNISIPFSLPPAVLPYEVFIEVYDMQGREIHKEQKDYIGGYHTWQYDPNNQHGSLQIRVLIQNHIYKYKRSFTIIRDK